MNSLNFEDLSITTMVACFYLQGNVERDIAFNMLPLTEVKLPNGGYRTKKSKIPHTGRKDDIVSLRYNGVVRGIAKTTKSGAFPHSIAIDLTTNDKYLALKLSSETVHICGASSENMATSGAQSIINHILTIQSLLNFINKESKEVKEIVEEVKQITRGNAILIPGNGDLKARLDYHLLVPTNSIAFNRFSPEGRELASFLLSHVSELRWYSDFCSKLEWIMSKKTICSPDLAIKSMTPIMINYNYKLDFVVNREVLCRAFNGRGGFFARYDNAVQHNVTIILPYSVDEKIPHIRKRKANPRHTFMVYQSGNVTQSGPSKELMGEAFEKFKSIITDVQEEISMKNETISCKQVEKMSNDSPA